MKLIFIALMSGILFGFGLALGQMTNPEKVLNFLDIAGNWDPSLIFVMLGALSVTMVGFRFVLKRTCPLLEARFYLPAKKEIDKPLLLGAAFFGVGWGIAGYCPGPVVAGLGMGNLEAVVMIGSIYLGILSHRMLDK